MAHEARAVSEAAKKNRTAGAGQSKGGTGGGNEVGFTVAAAFFRVKLNNY